MSRAAVWDVLTDDTELKKLGITEDSVFQNYTLEERPIQSGPFLILRWGDSDRSPFIGVKSPVRLTIWIHWPIEETNDFSKLDRIFDLCDVALEKMNGEIGIDGYTITCVRSTGRSGDLKDDGFQTISKNASYEVLSRKT